MVFRSLILSFLLLLAVPTLANDTGNTWSGSKDELTLSDPGTPDGREGGEDMSDAYPIPSIPFNDTGNTCDNEFDYDVMCPYGGWGPDVVYAYYEENGISVDIDLCGSSYDTKLMVFRGTPSDYEFYGCNDDFYWGEPCGIYVSKIEDLWLEPGWTYFIVVSAYGGDCGDYILAVTEHLPCIVECPADGLPEGEPPLEDGYVDHYNGGCNSTPYIFFPLNEITEWPDCTTLCGVSGWYEYSGMNYRDTDWYEVVVTEPGELEFTVDAEYAVTMYVLAPPCEGIQILHTATAGPCAPATLAWPSEPGQVYWLWVGPPNFDAPVNEFDYVMTVCGLTPITTQKSSWGTVKNIYR